MNKSLAPKNKLNLFFTNLKVWFYLLASFIFFQASIGTQTSQPEIKSAILLSISSYFCFGISCYYLKKILKNFQNKNNIGINRLMGIISTLFCSFLSLILLLKLIFVIQHFTWFTNKNETLTKILNLHALLPRNRRHTVLVKRHTEGTRIGTKLWWLVMSYELPYFLKTLLQAQKKRLRKSLDCSWNWIETPRAGFEPATNRLTVDRSTAELPRNIKWI